LNVLIWIPLGVYFAYLGFVIIQSFRLPAVDSIGYLLVGRKLTLPAFVASLVASWYGGILGVSEFSWRYGVSMWFILALPYYLAAFVMALFLAKRIRNVNLVTIPEQFRQTYGPRIAILGALIIFLQTTPAPYLLELGKLCEYLFSIPKYMAIPLCAFFSMAYVLRGGLGAVVKTDKIQFVLMFIGFILIVAMARNHFGGLPVLKENLPSSLFVWHGGHSPWVIFSWYLLAMVTLIEPNFYQRCAAAKSPAVAQRGIFFSILCWAVFDFLTLSAGLYAHMAFPNLESPMLAYPMLSQLILPPFLHGIFLTSLFAIIMSTIDSFTFVSATTFGYDILGILFSGKKMQENQQRWTRWGLAVTVVTSICIALFSESVVAIWYWVGSIGIPAILIPALAMFIGRPLSSAEVRLALIGSFLLNVAQAMTQAITENGDYLWGIQPILPGLIWGLFIWGISCYRNRSYKGIFFS